MVGILQIQDSLAKPPSSVHLVAHSTQGQPTRKSGICCGSMQLNLHRQTELAPGNISTLQLSSAGKTLGDQRYRDLGAFFVSDAELCTHEIDLFGKTRGWTRADFVPYAGSELKATRFPYILQGVAQLYKHATKKLSHGVIYRYPHSSGTTNT